MSKREMADKAKVFVLKCMYVVNTVLIICHLGFAFFYNYYDMDILYFLEETQAAAELCVKHGNRQPPRQLSASTLCGKRSFKGMYGSRAVQGQEYGRNFWGDF